MLALLTTATPTYELSHHSLSVLRALMTFLPNRIITSAPQSALVIRFNKTLGASLNGMPESTGCRHIAQLIKAGIVSRHDSANRKRFARRAASLGQIAFGFDLSPLAREVGDLRHHANLLDIQAEEHAALRVYLAHLRQTLIELTGPCDLTDASFRALRRKSDTNFQNALSTKIDATTAHQIRAIASQNERHIQKKIYLSLTLYWCMNKPI